MTDLEALLKACIKNDRRAHKKLYERYFNFLMSVCYRYQKSYDDAMFLLNTGFIKVIKSLDKYDFEKPFEPWLKTVMVNVAIDEYRKNKKYHDNTILLDDIKWSKMEEKSSLIDDDADLNIEDYWELVRQVPDPGGTVFNLFVIDNYGHKEIADKLNISERSSKRYLSTARLWLLEKIKMNHVTVKQYG